MSDNNKLSDEVMNFLTDGSSSFDDNLGKNLKSKELNWSDEKYYSDRAYLASTHLKLLRSEGPEGLLNYFEDGQDDKADFAYGRAFHCINLELNEFSKRFYSINDHEKCIEISGPDWKDKRKKPRNTTQYKEWLGAMHQKHDGKMLIQHEDMTNLMNMSAKLEKIEEYRILMNGAVPEVSVMNTLEGVKCKCKIDALRKDLRIGVDLKSTKDIPTPENIPYIIKKYGYDMQGAFYSDVAELEQFILVFIQKSYPYTIGVYEMSEETLKIGREKYRRALKMYKNHFIRPEDKRAIKSFYYRGLC